MTKLKLSSTCLLFACSLFGQINYNTQISNLPSNPSAKFQFTIRPGNITSGSLASSGAKTLTLRPCPLYVNGADVDHYMWISGGTGSPGTDELVLITGGTCTSGAATGTLSFVTSNNHSGAYTITSASSGIQEAVTYVQSLSTGGEITLPAGNTYIYKTVTIQPANSPAVTISGCGTWCSTLILNTNATTDDVFYCTGAACLVYFRDMTIGGHASHTAGAAIRVKDNTAGKPKIENVRAVDTFGGFYINNSDYVQIINSYYDQESNTNAQYGIKIDGISSDIQINGGRYAAAEINVPTMLDYGLWITGGDGITVYGAMFRGNIGVYINPVYGTGTMLLGSIFFTGGSIIDRCRTSGVKILSSGVPAIGDFFGEVYFSNSHISGHVDMETDDLVYIDLTTMAADYAGISFVGMKMNNGNRHGIYATNINGLNVSNSRIVNNDIDNVGGSAIRIVSGTALSITGNTLSDFSAVPKQDYGLNLSGTVNIITVSGNTASGNVTSPYNNGATLTSGVFAGNQGSDDLISTVASAATITIPSSLPKTIAITSTTTIDTINGFTGSGDVRRFICPSGLTFSAAGNVKRLLATTMANQVVTCTYNAGDSKWYCQ